MTTPSGSIRPPLQGIRVVDVAPTLATAMATQFLADSGAEVIMVEPPGGSPLRALAGWPVLGRGKHSVVLDLATDDGHAALLELLTDADVLVEATRPGRTRTRLTKDALHERFPRLVAASVSGWGSAGPWRDLKGYEGLVMAKTGITHATRRMQNPPRPGFISVPYASYGAAHAAVHGILAALLEREHSGVGQSVETDLVRGVFALDAWNWFGELVCLRWPDAYQTVEAWGEDGEPRSPMLLALLTAPTKDGHWLQFAQVSPALFGAMLDEFGLAPLLADPKWVGFPNLGTAELRREFWCLMIAKVRERTLAQWQQVFIDRPDISAEIFRHGSDVLTHPQLVHDGRTLTVDTAAHGPVTQPTTLVHHNGAPLLTPGPPPTLDEHPAAAARSRGTASEAPAAASTAPPLRDVTIVEFGEMFASPYASSLLADLGARVIKVESIEGDQIRNLLPFPEIAGAKAMQGKHSVQVDLHSPAGQAVAHKLVAGADIVVQSFRAGAVERLGIDEATLRRIKPDLVYLNAPGYGTDGPFAGRPAYAPSIGAAAGLALVNVPDAQGATTTMDDITATAPKLTTATAAPEVQGDGLAAVSVASAMLLGLLARQRHGSACHFTTTMLASMTHVLSEWVSDYPDKPAALRVDSEGAGYTALYRQYESTDGWLFLAAPQDKEWPALVAALRDYLDLAGDERFATAELRRSNDAALRDALSALFTKEAAAHWESLLAKHDLGCVALHMEVPSRQMQSDPELVAAFTATADSPVFDEHLRLAPLCAFSRSATDPRGGCTAGQHTTVVLREFGYSEAEIAALRDDNVIAGE
jgi:crotonobetainyl-CoA:carnitine CoA-transferase CaiB-like acyl-CoA transferase